MENTKMTGNLIEGISSTRDFGSVSNVPRLPEGFNKIFKSYMVDTGEIEIHAVIGGKGEPLLLHAGWPENWYAWRDLMIPLSEHFTVIAADPRGLGLSGRPDGGFDAVSLAQDMLRLMEVLGYEKFSFAGHDLGVIVGYAMASLQPDRIVKLAMGEAIIPGAMPSLPLIADDRRINDFLWHFNFNRALEVNERLVEGREEIFFGYQFESKSGHPDAIPKYARDFYIELLRRKPGTLKASFEYYRSIDETIPQVREMIKTKLLMPVLTFAGALASADLVEQEWRTLAENVESVIIPDCGHFPAEEKPEMLLKALLNFLLPNQ